MVTQENMASNLTSQLDPYSPGECFIATAVYGSGQHQHVLDLKYFRDAFLARKRLGRLLIQTYYFFSPPLAKIIAKTEVLKAIVRLSIVKPAWTLAKSYLE